MPARKPGGHQIGAHGEGHEHQRRRVQAIRRKAGDLGRRRVDVIGQDHGALPRVQGRAGPPQGGGGVKQRGDLPGHPCEGEHGPREDRPRGGGQDGVPHHLPAGGSEGGGRLPHLRRDGPQGLLPCRDGERQGHEGQGQAAGRRRDAQPQPCHQRRHAEQPQDDGRHRAQGGDAGTQEPGHGPGRGILDQVHRSPDPHREGNRQGPAGEHDAPPQGGPDATPAQEVGRSPHQKVQIQCGQPAGHEQAQDGQAG